MGKSIGLSIDFDWFVPEHEMLDFAHREDGGFFREALWTIRAGQMMGTGTDLVAEMNPEKADVQPLKLISTLREAGWQIDPECQFTISDSHVHAYSAFSGHIGWEIVNLDAHHDMGYAPKAAMAKRWKAGSIQCEDWAWFLLKGRHVHRVSQVYPTWKGDVEISDTNHWKGTREATKFTPYVYSPELLPKLAGTVRGIHLARSSAWVPPWCDHVVVEMIESIEREVGAKAVLLGEIRDESVRKYLDPRVCRTFDLKAAEQIAFQEREFMAKFKNKTGT